MKRFHIRRVALISIDCGEVEAESANAAKASVRAIEDVDGYRVDEIKPAFVVVEDLGAPPASHDVLDMFEVVQLATDGPSA